MEWGLTVHDGNLNAQVPPIKAPIPYILQLVEDIQRATEDYCAMSNLANVFSSVLIPRSPSPIVCIFEGTQHTFPRLPMGDLISQAIAHNLCWQNLDALTVSPRTVRHYIDGILTRGALEDVVHESLAWLVTHLQGRG